MTDLHDLPDNIQDPNGKCPPTWTYVKGRVATDDYISIESCDLNGNPFTEIWYVCPPSTPDGTPTIEWVDTIQNGNKLGVRLVHGDCVSRADYELTCVEENDNLYLIDFSDYPNSIKLIDFAGNDVTGTLTPKPCPTKRESDGRYICVNGETLTQWVVKEAGEPTGDVYYTNAIGAIVPAPTGEIVPGICSNDIIEYEGNVVCAITTSGQTVSAIRNETYNQTSQQVDTTFITGGVDTAGNPIATDITADVASWTAGACVIPHQYGLTCVVENQDLHLIDLSAAPTIVSVYQLDGTDVTGTVTPTSCSTKIESDGRAICVNGVDVMEWAVKENGRPTGAMYYTDITGAITAAPVDTDTITVGSCSLLACLEDIKELIKPPVPTIARVFCTKDAEGNLTGATFVCKSVGEDGQEVTQKLWNGLNQSEFVAYDAAEHGSEHPCASDNIFTECVKWQLNYAAEDNTGSQWETLAQVQRTYSNGAVVTSSQTSQPPPWTGQMSERIVNGTADAAAVGIQADGNLHFADTVPYTDPVNGQVIPPFPTGIEFNSMRARFLLWKFCAGQPYITEVLWREQFTDGSFGDWVKMDLEYTTGAEYRGWRCINKTTKTVELYWINPQTGLFEVVPEADTPPLDCIRPCVEDFPPTPASDSATPYWFDACDDVLANGDENDFVDIQVRVEEVDGIFTATYWEFDTNGGLVEYNGGNGIVGVLVDCESGEAISLPTPICEEFEIVEMYSLEGKSAGARFREWSGQAEIATGDLEAARALYESVESTPATIDNVKTTAVAQLADTNALDGEATVQITEFWACIRKPTPLRYLSGTEGAMFTFIGKCGGPYEPMHEHTSSTSTAGGVLTNTYIIPSGIHKFKFANVDNGGVNSVWQPQTTADGINYTTVLTLMDGDASTSAPYEVCKKIKVCEKTGVLISLISGEIVDPESCYECSIDTCSTSSDDGLALSDYAVSCKGADSYTHTIENNTTDLSYSMNSTDIKLDASQPFNSATAQGVIDFAKSCIDDGGTVTLLITDSNGDTAEFIADSYNVQNEPAQYLFSGEGTDTSPATGKVRSIVATCDTVDTRALNNKICNVSELAAAIGDAINIPEPTKQWIVINRYRLDGVTGDLRNRHWNDQPLDAGSAVNYTTEFGRTIRETFNYSTNPDLDQPISTLSMNDIDDTADSNGVELTEGFMAVTTPFYLRWGGGSEGYIAIEVDKCCSGMFDLKTELGRGVGASNTAPVFYDVGIHAIRNTNIDSGGTNSSWPVEYSTNGTDWTAGMPTGVMLSRSKPVEVCEEFRYCPETMEVRELFSDAVVDLDALGYYKNPVSCSSAPILGGC